MIPDPQAALDAAEPFISQTLEFSGDSAGDLGKRELPRHTTNFGEKLFRDGGARWPHGGMNTTTRNAEARIRRHARAQGWLLVKSRVRDPWHDTFGCYVLVDDTIGNHRSTDRPYGGQAAVSAFANGEHMTLLAVAAYLGVSA